MLVIECPYCGSRDSSEFSYGADASISRPADPEAVSDSEWTNYLYFRENPKGSNVEHWFHRDGCRTWLKVRRSTLTHEIEAVSTNQPDLGKSAREAAVSAPPRQRSRRRRVPGVPVRRPSV
jgi:heterotetrameric sarcosine oxidase delta subunit